MSLLRSGHILKPEHGVGFIEKRDAVLLSIRNECYERLSQVACVLSLFNARHLTARLGLSFPAHVRSLCSARVTGITRCTKLCTFALSCAALPSPWIGLEQVCNVGASVGIRTCCVASRTELSPRQCSSSHAASHCIAPDPC